MDKKVLADLIYRLRSGTATQEELEKLEAFWRDSHSDGAFLKDHTTDELERIGQDMYHNIEEKVIAATPRSRTLWTGTYLYRAAAVLLTLVSFSAWFYFYSSQEIEVRTGYGERLTVSLPDHSSVILNGNSAIRYSSEWDEDSPREIWMEGEGFFSVTHQQNHQKFIVHANRIDVEVLGTKFNVKARPRVSEVMLTEGKVKLALPSDENAASVFLNPGEVATMNSNGLSKRVAKREHLTSWVQNKLYFDRTPLRVVAEMLKETHGLNVRFSVPELEQRELSGEISLATEEDILYAIATTFNLQFVREGQSVTISEKSD